MVNVWMENVWLENVWWVNVWLENVLEPDDRTCEGRLMKVSKCYEEDPKDEAAEVQELADNVRYSRVLRLDGA